MDVPDGWTTGTVNVGDVELQYYRTGEGPSIVMAHGFYDNGRCWIPLASDLANDYDVVTYDARGHGRSDAPETGYDIESRVADLVGVVSGLDIDDPVLLGHSMGGATVAWAASEHPNLPRGLVLEDPVGLYDSSDMDPDERAQVVRERLEDRSVDSIEHELREKYDDPDPEWVRRCAVASTECSPVIAEIAREGYPELRGAFEQIQCPTLVLKRDTGPERRVRDLDAADALVNGRLVHIPGAGHYVFQTEYDAAFSELRTFLERL